MKLFRSLPLLVVVAVAMLAGSARAEATWLTDLKQAQEKAKAEKKLLLLDFTGSDWCGWCIKLRKEVFSQPEFQNYADKNLVLMEVDFPRRKALTPSVQQQNEELAQKFRIEGFPTIVVLDGEGKPLGALSYDSAIAPDSQKQVGSPTAFIANIEKLKKS